MKYFILRYIVGPLIYSIIKSFKYILLFIMLISKPIIFIHNTIYKHSDMIIIYVLAINITLTIMSIYIRLHK